MCPVEQREKGGPSAEVPDDTVERALRPVEAGERSTGEEHELPPTLEPEALRAENERLREALAAAEERGRAAAAKLEAEHDRLLRAAADLDNARKRAAREREEGQRFANERLLKDLLPILDNLDRALAAAAMDHPLASGVRLVQKGFEDTLARWGVRAFSALGNRFDPTIHEAIAQVPAAGAAPGTVMAEHGRGFFLHDRLIRPAVVSVAASPAEPPPGVPPRDGAGAADG